MDKMIHMKPDRDYTIELWRFLFCIVVFGLHFFSETKYTFFRAGYLGVEFFLLLSGYGVYCYYEKHMKSRSLRERFWQLGIYIISRLKRLYPLYIFSLFFMLTFRVITENWSVSDIFTYLRSGWAEFLMLQCGPLGNEVLLNVNWYVAAMFWGSIFLLLILMFTGKYGTILICPLMGLGIYAYFFHLICKIDVIISYYAEIRAVAGLSIGIFIGAVVQYIRKKLPEISSIFYCMANILLAGVFVYTNFGRRSAIDFVVIGVYAVSLTLLLLVQRNMPKRLTELFAKLGKISYPIYILQKPVIKTIFFLLKL